MSFEVLSLYCVVGEVLFFNVVGIFGNTQLLWTSVRKSFTYTKPVIIYVAILMCASGILLAINAALHIVCLLSEGINAIFIAFLRPFTRRQCFSFIAPYMFVVSQQAVMTLVISIDLLNALLFPFWYRTCRTAPYILIAFFTGSVYSFSILIWGYIAQDDEIIPFCNPPLGLAPSASKFWSVSNVFINFCVLVVYSIIIGFVNLKKKWSTSKDQQKVLRRLKVIMIVFICSWFIAILGVNLGDILGFSPDFLQLWQSNMVFFGLICYSQTFYVCIWRSAEYRRAFIEQLQLMTCRKPENKSDLSTSHVTRTMVVQDIQKNVRN